MSWILGWWRTSLGGKVVMSVTGLLLTGFLVGHMAGNLLVFRGQDAINAYAAFLKSQPGLLWSVRLGLLATFAIHITTGVRLARANRAARPERYVREGTVQASLASRSMIWTGLVVAAFVVFHLLHFTVGAVQPKAHALADATGRHDVYSMVVLGFRNWPIALSYVVAVVLLGLHLSHGLHSLAQSLGLRHARLTPALEKAAPILSAVLIVGFLSVPLSVLLRIAVLPSEMNS